MITFSSGRVCGFPSPHFITVLLMTVDMGGTGTKGGGTVCRAEAELVLPSGQPLCKQAWSWLVCRVKI